MRFLADENVPRPIIERLRAEGHHVRAVIDDRARAPDSDVLQAADLSGMILVTQDQDFGELVIQGQLPVAGIVLLQTAQLPLHR
jgi:predicted nuclease of predicted toxin-antitoxin system